MYGMKASMRAVISRLSPLRPTATWPASPEEASTPANVTSVSVNAKTRSLADGVPPMVAGLVSTSGLNTISNPRITIVVCRIRSKSTTKAKRS